MRTHVLGSAGAQLLCALLLLGGCPEAASDSFPEPITTSCNASWPVCNTTAGCFVGNGYYLEGQFPGTRRFIVRTGGPAKIAVSISLEKGAAAGKQLRIEWNETSCATKFVEQVDGQAFFKEAETEGALIRAHTVSLPGDHLIEVTSDSTADYILRPTITAPTGN